MLCRPHNMPTVAQDIDAQVCWMDESAPLAAGASTTIKHTTRWARALVEGHRLPDRRQHAPPRRGRRPARRSTRSAAIQLRATQPLFIDPYLENRATGAFILVDEASNKTVAAGMIGRLPG